jgi:predicted nucleic acid-binding protein
VLTAFTPRRLDVEPHEANGRIAARDALYVAAATSVALLTTDGRRSRAVPDLAIELAW